MYYILIRRARSMLFFIKFWSSLSSLANFSYRAAVSWCSYDVIIINYWGSGLQKICSTLEPERQPTVMCAYVGPLYSCSPWCNEPDLFTMVNLDCASVAFVSSVPAAALPGLNRSIPTNHEDCYLCYPLCWGCRLRACPERCVWCCERLRSLR